MGSTATSVMLQNHYEHAVKESLRNRWDQEFLKHVHSAVSVEIIHQPDSFSTIAKCRVGMVGQHVYESSCRIDDGVLESGYINEHPEWIEHHAKTMVRMAETGVFLRFFERALEPKHRSQFNKMYASVKSVTFVPGDGRSDKIDGGWLAVVIFDDGMGKYSEVMREISADPHHFLALLTMVQK